MRHYLILLSAFLLLISCDQKKSDNIIILCALEFETNAIGNQKGQDTIFNYWEIILDTVAVQKEFKILNKNYNLELKTFSLNDSLIVRSLGQGESQVYLDHTHTMVTDFVLTSDSITDRKRIDRTDFKKSLIPEFYMECNLFSTEIDSIVGNRIYLISDLAVPDTDNQWRIWYLIKVTNNRLGKIEIKETNYVGL